MACDMSALAGPRGPHTLLGRRGESEGAGRQGVEEQGDRELQYSSGRSASVQSTLGEKRQPCIDSGQNAEVLVLGDS